MAARIENPYVARELARRGARRRGPTLGELHDAGVSVHELEAAARCPPGTVRWPSIGSPLCLPPGMTPEQAARRDPFVAMAREWGWFGTPARRPRSGVDLTPSPWSWWGFDAYVLEPGARAWRRLDTRREWMHIGTVAERFREYSDAQKRSAPSGFEYGVLRAHQWLGLPSAGGLGWVLSLADTLEPLSLYPVGVAR